MHRLILAFLALVAIAPAVELRSETERSYQSYWNRIDRELAARRNFLIIDTIPGLRQKVRNGEIYVERRESEDPPRGLVHHFEGAVFIPNATLPQVLRKIQDYNNHKLIYGPEVMASQILSNTGNHYRIRLRLLKKRIVTVVLETEHDVRYREVAPTRWESISRSEKISEVDDPGEKSEKQLPPGKGNGYVWKLDSFWRFEEADGGVYVECTSLSLSRDVPFGMARVIRPIIEELPEASLRNVLEQTRRAFRSAAR